MTLPLKAGIAFSGLSPMGRSNSQRILSMKSSTTVDTVLDFQILSNLDFVENELLTISGVNGLDNSLVSTVFSLENSDIVSIKGLTKLTFGINYIESYSRIDSSHYYYVDIWLSDSTTINRGTSIIITGLPAPFNALNGLEYIVHSASSHKLTLRTIVNPPFGVAVINFPLIGNSLIPPNTSVETFPLTTRTPVGVVSVKNTNGYIPSSLLVSSLSSGIYSSSATLSDHNRASIQVSYEEIEQTERTVDGTLRYHHTASKRKYSLSWKDLPADSSGTVDGFSGGKDMLDIYMNNKGAFYLLVNNRNSARKTSLLPESKLLVRFSDFSYEIVKRNFVISETGKLTDLWNVNFSLEEL